MGGREDALGTAPGFGPQSLRDRGVRPGAIQRHGKRFPKTATLRVVHACDSSSQGHRAQQCVDLPERILLPLRGRAITQQMGVFDEASHAGGAMSVKGVELVVDVPETTLAACMPK
jgi:hypothetical protein